MADGILLGVTATTPSSASEDSRCRFVFFLVLGGVCAVGQFARDLYLPALTTRATYLSASSRAVKLTITTFLAVD
jgi:hypothetical protein